MYKTSLFLFAFSFYWIVGDSLGQVPLPTFEPQRMECDSFQIMERSLQGKVNGQQWNFKSGFATRKLILLFNNDVSPCDPLSFRNRNYVRINVRPSFKPAVYDLENPEGADYVIDVKNIKNGVPCYGCLACGEMRLEIDDRTEILTGRIHAQWMDGDYVNGSFTIPLCFDFETD